MLTNIRKVNPSGILSTIAGTGTWSYSGDGGPGQSAGISQTMSPVFDASGNLYFADMDNNCIRQLIPTAVGN
jgi:internalin A